MKKVDDILNEKKSLKDKAYQIMDLCKKEIRSFTDEEAKEIEEIKQQLEELDRKLRSFEEEEETVEEVTEEKTEEVEEVEEEVKSEEVEDEEETEEKSEECNDSEEEKEEKYNKRHFNTMKQRFSILSAIRNIANNKPQDDITSAVLNAGNSEMRKAGLNYVGQIQLPTEVRALTVTDEGEDVVATDLLDIVKPLQAKNVMVQAGAKYITGLVGDIQYPVMSKSSCTWEDETGEAKDGSVQFTNIKLSPKRLTTVVPISKQFLVQDSVGAENAIREEIINAINAKLEATILGNGAGSATEPKGMFATAGENVTSFEDICDLEAKLEEADVYGELKYIVSPKAKAALRSMPKSSKSTQLVYENNEIDGTTALSTSNVKETNIIYGDFSQYVIAQWGNLDITVDNVTLASKGQIRLVVNAYFDMKPLREEAFKTGKIVAE